MPEPNRPSASTPAEDAAAGDGTPGDGGRDEESSTMYVVSEQVRFSVPRPSLARSVLAGIIGLALLIVGVALAVFVFLPIAILVMLIGLGIVLWARLRARLNNPARVRRNVRVVDPRARD
jgi:hypothetical protein